MADPEFYRGLFAYNRKVLDNYAARLSRMSWKQATRDLGSGQRSFRSTLVHIIRVHEAWLNYIANGRTEELHRSWRDPDSYRSAAEVRAYLRSTWKGVDELLEGLTPARLRRRVKAPWMPVSCTLEDALIQCTFEQAHHIGELIALFWQRDEVPPQMMWIPVRTGRRVSVA